MLACTGGWFLILTILFLVHVCVAHSSEKKNEGREVDFVFPS